MYNNSFVSPYPAVPFPPSQKSTPSSETAAIDSSKGLNPDIRLVEEAIIQTSHGSRSHIDYLKGSLRAHPKLVERLILQNPSYLNQNLIQNCPELTKLFPKAERLLALNPSIFLMPRDFIALYSSDSEKEKIAEGRSSLYQNIIQRAKLSATPHKLALFELQERVDAIISTPSEPNIKNWRLAKAIERLDRKEGIDIIVNSIKYNPTSIYPELFDQYPELHQFFPRMQSVLKEDAIIDRTKAAEMARNSQDPSLFSTLAYCSARLTGHVLMNYFQVVGAAYEYEYGARLSQSDKTSDRLFGYYLMSDAASSPGGNFLYYWPNSYGHSMARSTIGFNDQMMGSIGKAGKDLAHSGQKAIFSAGHEIENIAKSTPQSAKQSLGKVKKHTDNLLPNANGMMKETRHLGNQAAHEFSSTASTVFHGVEHLGKQAQPALRSAQRVASNAGQIADGVNQAGKMASSAMSFFGQAGKALGSVASFASEIAKNL